MKPEEKFYDSEWDSYGENDENFHEKYLHILLDKLLEVNEELRSRFNALDADEGKYYKGKKKAYGELLLLFKDDIFKIKEKYIAVRKKVWEREEEENG